MSGGAARDAVTPQLELLGGPPQDRDTLRDAVCQILGLPSAQTPASASAEPEPEFEAGAGPGGGGEAGGAVVDDLATVADEYCDELAVLVARARAEWATVFPGHGVDAPPAGGRAQQWFWCDDGADTPGGAPSSQHHHGERAWVPYTPFDCCRIEHHRDEYAKEEGRRTLRSEEPPLLTAADGVAWLAAGKGDSRRLRQALWHQANPNLRAPLHLRESLLHAVCRLGHLSCARMLLQGESRVFHPADSLLRDADGNTALEAAKHGARVGSSWWQPQPASDPAAQPSAVDALPSVQTWGDRAQQGVLLEELQRRKRFAKMVTHDRSAARKR
jgi:hypothetical protein